MAKYDPGDYVKAEFKVERKVRIHSKARRKPDLKNDISDRRARKGFVKSFLGDGFGH